MRKLFISADIEGTCGIANWNEADKNHKDHAYFSQQMTREVCAACIGAHRSGFTYVCVKDSHDTARNIIPNGLPEYAEIIRGRPNHPYRMMFGLDKSFDGVVLTGYHSGAGMAGNPLGHTINLQNNYIKINGELCNEFMMNAMLASSLGLPVYAVTGDRELCDLVNGVNPNILTVSTNEGYASCSKSVHPDLAVRLIEETVEKAVKQDRESCMYPLPSEFIVEVCFKEYSKTAFGSFYPGAVQTDINSLRFETKDFFEVLRFFHFVL